MRGVAEQGLLDGMNIGGCAWATRCGLPAQLPLDLLFICYLATVSLLTTAPVDIRHGSVARRRGESPQHKGRNTKDEREALGGTSRHLAALVLWVR